MAYIKFIVRYFTERCDAVVSKPTVSKRGSRLATQPGDRSGTTWSPCIVGQNVLMIVPYGKLDCFLRKFFSVYHHIYPPLDGMKHKHQGNFRSKNEGSMINRRDY